MKIVRKIKLVVRAAKKAESRLIGKEGSVFGGWKLEVRNWKNLARAM